MSITAETATIEIDTAAAERPLPEWCDRIFGVVDADDTGNPWVRRSLADVGVAVATAYEMISSLRGSVELRVHDCDITIYQEGPLSVRTASIFERSSGWRFTASDVLYDDCSDESCIRVTFGEQH